VAHLIALVTAREVRQIRAGDYHKTSIYVSSEAHHCLEKALKFAGMKECKLRKIQVDSQLRMSVKHLRETLRIDREELGLTPFCLVATAGTTNSGERTITVYL